MVAAMNHRLPFHGCFPTAGAGNPSFQAMFPQSRRDFLKHSVAVLPGAALLSFSRRVDAAATPDKAPGKPNSKVAGVQIGMNVPYSFRDRLMSGDDTLKNCVELGISAVELRTQPVEAFLGVPAELISPKKNVSAGSAAATAKQLAQWRKSVPMDRVKTFRDQYESAGVRIEIVKVDGIFQMSDDELDYVFPLARTLGARAIATEITRTEADLKRLGQFADKHQLMVGYHGHATTKPEHWEEAFALATHNGANVDIAHFVAGGGGSPVPFLQKHHDRITHVHIKDRKKNNGPSVPFGEGDTPIGDVLRLIRDNRWNIQATIEFDYKVPTTSDLMTELRRAIQFCRDALA